MATYTVNRYRCAYTGEAMLVIEKKHFLFGWEEENRIYFIKKDESDINKEREKIIDRLVKTGHTVL
jgi:hypothetical protein